MGPEPTEASTETPDAAEPDVTPLLHPADGVPDLSTTVGEIKPAAELLAGGHGPFAVDAERASGFRYSNRAYLIQIRRAGAGTVLIDPVSHGGDALAVLRPVGWGLAKGHGAADWSKRPLPAAWLNYASLDVELLIDLRHAIAGVLAEQGKTDWAAEEFDYLRTVGEAPPPTRRDRWRRTSGIHRVRNQQALAAVRELWMARDGIAQRRD